MLIRKFNFEKYIIQALRVMHFPLFVLMNFSILMYDHLEI